MQRKGMSVTVELMDKKGTTLSQLGNSEILSNAKKKNNNKSFRRQKLLDAVCCVDKAHDLSTVTNEGEAHTSSSFSGRKAYAQLWADQRIYTLSDT